MSGEEEAKEVQKGSASGQSESAAQRATTEGVAKREPQRARQASRHPDGKSQRVFADNRV